MPVFEKGDVVRVPFPYTNRPIEQRRPALVVSAGPIGAQGHLLWVLMITSADNRPWPGDVAIERYGEAGLPAPSVVRTAKIATIEAGRAEKIGALAPALLEEITEAVRGHLGDA